MATDGVEGAPLIDFVTPDRRVLALHGGALVTVGIEVGEHLDMLGKLLEVVPLVGAGPLLWQVCGGRMLLVLDLDQRRLDARVAGEVSPDQLAVEGPLIFGIGRGMDADIATAAADPLLEQLLLRRGEHVLGGVEKHHHLMLLQFRCSEPCRIFRHLDVKTKLLAEDSERFLPRFDAAVAKTCGAAEDEDRLETGVAVGLIARTLLCRCRGGGGGDGRIDRQRAGGALETGGETGREDDGEQ